MNEEVIKNAIEQIQEFKVEPVELRVGSFKRFVDVMQNNGFLQHKREEVNAISSLYGLRVVTNEDVPYNEAHLMNTKTGELIQVFTLRDGVTGNTSAFEAGDSRIVT